MRSTAAWRSGRRSRFSQPTWITDKKVRFLAQSVLERSPQLPQTPTFIELAATREAKTIFEFMALQNQTGRAIFAPPGVPADRVAALRRAFDAAVKDAAMLSELERAGMEIEPSPGEAVQAIVAKMINTPPDIVARMRQLLEQETPEVPCYEDQYRSHIDHACRQPAPLAGGAGAIHAKATDKAYDHSAYDRGMGSVVADSVRRQADAGLDVVNDGEHSKTSFVAYIVSRLGGFEPVDGSQRPRLPPTRDAGAFAAVYEDIAKLTAMRRQETPLRLPRIWMRCTGPITYTGHATVQADLGYLKAALGGVPAEEAFMTALSPSNVALNLSQRVSTGPDEEYLSALADAMHVEYQAIVDAGFIAAGRRSAAGDALRPHPGRDASRNAASSSRSGSRW